MGCMQRLNLRRSYGVLPYMSEDLIISVSDATSTLILPFLGGLVLGQLFVGSLSDRFGRIPVFIIFLNLYALASLMCIFVDNVYVLVIFRALTGLASSVGEISVRAIINDFCTLNSGTKVLSRVKATTFLIAGLSPIIMGEISKRVTMGWRSFFVMNAMYCCCVSAVAIYLITNLRTQPDEKALTAKKISQNLKNTLGNRQYLFSVIAFVLINISIHSMAHFTPVIVLEYFKMSKEWLSILYAVLIGGLGFISLQVNALLIGRFSVLTLAQMGCILLFTIGTLFTGFFLLVDNIEMQFMAYLAFVLITAICGHISTVNFFAIVTQSLRNSTTGGGFICSLTVSLATAANFVAGGNLSLLQGQPMTTIVLANYILLSITVLYVSYVAAPTIRSVADHPANMK